MFERNRRKDNYQINRLPLVCNAADARRFNEHRVIPDRLTDILDSTQKTARSYRLFNAFLETDPETWRIHQGTPGTEDSATVLYGAARHLIAGAVRLSLGPLSEDLLYQPGFPHTENTQYEVNRRASVLVLKNATWDKIVSTGWPTNRAQDSFVAVVDATTQNGVADFGVVRNFQLKGLKIADDNNSKNYPAIAFNEWLIDLTGTALIH